MSEAEWLALMGEEDRIFLRFTNPAADIKNYEVRYQRIWNDFSSKINDFVSNGSLTTPRIDSLLERSLTQQKVLFKWYYDGRVRLLIPKKEASFMVNCPNNLKQTVYKKMRRSEWELWRHMLEKAQSIGQKAEKERKTAVAKPEEIEEVQSEQPLSEEEKKRIKTEKEEIEKKIEKDFLIRLKSELEDEKAKWAEQMEHGHLTLEQEKQGIRVTSATASSNADLDRRQSLDSDEKKFDDDDQEFEEEEKYDGEGNPKQPLSRSAEIDVKTPSAKAIAQKLVIDAEEDPKKDSPRTPSSSSHLSVSPTSPSGSSTPFTPFKNVSPSSSKNDDAAAVIASLFAGSNRSGYPEQPNRYSRINTILSRSNHSDSLKQPNRYLRINTILSRSNSNVRLTEKEIDEINIKKLIAVGDRQKSPLKNVYKRHVICQMLDR